MSIAGLGRRKGKSGQALSSSGLALTGLFFSWKAMLTWDKLNQGIGFRRWNSFLLDLKYQQVVPL